VTDQPDEIIKLRVKPNPLLYALEATKFFLFVIIFPLAVALLFSFRGLPLYLGLEIGLTIFFFGYLVLFFAVVLNALTTEFIVTDQRVLLRSTFLGVADRIDIRLQDIEVIEERSYNARYGSLYIISSSDGLFCRPSYNPASERCADLVVKSSRLAIWLSAPFTAPPMRGFYGFNQFDTFAKLIVQLQLRQLNETISPSQDYAATSSPVEVLPRGSPQSELAITQKWVRVWGWASLGALGMYVTIVRWPYPNLKDLICVIATVAFVTLAAMAWLGIRSNWSEEKEKRATRIALFIAGTVIAILIVLNKTLQHAASL
jgi:hypothetical protein